MRRYYQRRLPENPLEDYYFIIRDTNPAQSLLLEYGFIDNPNDQRKLEEDLLNYVEGVVRAVANYGGYTYTPPEGSEGDYYVVKKGDSLWSIAKKLGVTVQQLRDVNNLTSDILQVGQVLKIPNGESSPPNTSTTYTVKSGDSLWSIARDFGVTIQELREANNLTSDILQIGQVLVIPTISETPIETEEYVVKRGDSLWSIAKTFGVSVDDIKTANNLTTNLLQIGQVLIIPTESNIPPVTPTIYTVQRGDSLWTIARKFGTTVNAIREANGLTSDLLSIGMTLKIPTDL